MFIFTMIAIALMISTGSAQVDTLQLVEIGSIEAPAAITNLYIEDLDGDSLKEIILTTASNVHIYNGITYEPIWTSPDLDHPRDLLFADINLDSFIDFSVKDTTNIHLFDPHNDLTIWTSPAIDSTYKCYTIGDRNDDGWVDALIVNQVPTDTTYDNDTVWVKIYDGPSFDLSSSITAEFPRFEHSRDMSRWGRSEWPDGIYLGEADDFIEEPYLYLFSDYSSFSYEPTVGGSGNTGRIRVYNGLDLTNSYVQFIGNMEYFKTINESGHTSLYSYNSKQVFAAYTWSFFKWVTRCLPDTAISQIMWAQSFRDGNFPSYLFGTSIIDNIRASEGEEFCYSLVRYFAPPGNDSLFLMSLDGNELWTNADIHIISNIISGMQIALYDNPRLLLIGSQSHFILVDGESGAIVAVISGQGTPITQVVDLDADGNDEIFSLDNDMLHIYGLQRTAVDDDIPIPGFPYLSANYPNPFNSSTTIVYTLPETGEVTVEIFDLLGRSVETLIDEKQDAGAYRVTWDADEQASGVYFYKIAYGEFSDTRRMVLLK